MSLLKYIFKSVLLLGAIFLATSGAAFAAEVNLNIREGGNMIFSGTVALPTGITTTTDSENTAHDLNENSVLALLLSADAANETFEVSELTYFSSFDSLYLKCINSFCDDWQYVVNGVSPFSGIDQEILSGGETVWLYFGPTSQIELSADIITSVENVAVATQKYDYENNAWVVREGIVVGLTQPNPDDPFSPLEIMTASVNGNGQAVFSGIAAGTYDVGVKEDFYFPTKTLTVTAPASAPEPTGGGGGSSSGSRSKSSGSVLGAETKAKFNLPKAFEFLLSQQKEDGSWGTPIYTDWVAMALATGNYQENVIKLVKYLGTSLLEEPRLTDYERHAMVLMTLGLNPYNTNGVNYIQKIVEAFDGTQFGDKSEDNDDIFALIVLLNAGYTPEEEIVQKSLNFILGRQHDNGSWDESVDMTGAALQVLAQMPDSETKTLAITKAKGFLKEAQGQRLDGSWNNNASSTAWAIGGILALGEDLKDWERDDNTPIDFFATLQDTDGGIKGESVENRIWETAYAISAVSEKTWNEVMQKFEKQASVVPAPKPVVPKSKSIPAPKPAEPVPQPEISEPQQNWLQKFLNIFF